MPTNITPTLQTRVNDPYEQRLFDYGTSDSRLYLARVSNQLLMMLNDDVVLSGLEVESTSLSNSVATINIAKGLAIADRTLVKIDDSINTLEIDVAPYESTGKIIVHLNYGFLHTVEENPVRLKVSYVDDNGLTVSPDGWDWSKDRIILAIFDFEKDGLNNIISITNLITFYTSIDIQSHTFYLQGYDPDEDLSLDTYLCHARCSGSGSGEMYEQLYDNTPELIYDNSGEVVTVLLQQ